MLLKIQTPNKAIIEKNVTKIIAEGLEGSFGILPKHVDFVTVLIPSLVYFLSNDKEGYIAIDEGILVKKNQEVTLCVKEATGKRKLGELHKAMEEALQERFDESQKAHSELTKLELRFIKQFYDLQKEGL